MTMNMAPHWWQRGVIYQIYPRSFQDTNGDGVGDLRGVIARLDYLSWLGVDAIWLSPFYPSPGADFGYDISNYTNVDSMFGDLADFDALVAEAHRRGISVIVDYVPNHTSAQHPWFLDSRSSRENEKRDWYVWADAKDGGAPPNNWLSVFGGSAWEWDAATEQYYLHSFLAEQPDLNWRNPQVRAAMLDVLRFWLERGVDGFRIDVAHFIMKDPELRDNPPNPSARPSVHRSFGEYDSLLHVYSQAHPDVHDVFREIRRLLDAYSAERPRMAIGEVHIFDWSEWSRYYGAQLDELHLPFNFGLLGVSWDAVSVRKLVEELESVLPSGAWPNWVFGNHDEPRIASRIGAAPARVAMMMLLTLRGTPTLYYGDELGLENVHVSAERIRDPWGKRVPGLGLGRDPQRTPMQWDPSANAGFCVEGVTPWLPLENESARRNVATQLESNASMLMLTRALLALRREHPALHAGAYRALPDVPHDVFVFVRTDGRQHIVVALNFASEIRTVATPELANGRVLLSTHRERALGETDGTLTLAGNEGCIVSVRL